MDSKQLAIPDWPYVLGMPTGSGVIRSCPEDFYVEEIPRITPEGTGSHLWLLVQKRGANTDWVARELAKLARCQRRDVGYAGLKDRHAVTRQWFSVPDSESLRPGLENIDIEGVQLVETRHHTRKLKRGTLDGNQFKLRIRQLQADVGDMESRLDQIRTNGVPNYFGPQRFGHGGANVQKAFAALQKPIRLHRNKRSIYLSAIRAFLFNHVLAERVRRADWNLVLDGELVMLDGSHSIFPCEIPGPDIEERCQRHDIHPTGPLPGTPGREVTGESALLEQRVLQPWEELGKVLMANGVKASRRALRLYPAGLAWDIRDEQLDLEFSLPPGAYATTILREVLLVTDAA